MAKVFGIDLSTWQAGYPYSKATKDGVKFAILRAGFGKTKDNRFETHYKNAKAQGWGVGAYWYTYATTKTEAKKEAQAFVKVLKGKQFEYPIYLDIEDASLRKLGKTKLNSIVNAFAKVVKDAGYYFGVYTNVDWYKNVISGKTLNKKYDWWIASWTKSKPTGINADLWQFGGETNVIRSNKVAGITTDQNYAYKDYPSVIKAKGLNGFKKPAITYTVGNYKCSYNMNVRAGAGTNYRIKKVKELTNDGRRHATSKKPNNYARYKKGTIFTASKILKDSKGNIWGKSPSGYICIKGKVIKYCKKV